MKTRKMLALVFLVSFLGAGCAAVSPPIVEHEEFSSIEQEEELNSVEHEEELSSMEED